MQPMTRSATSSVLESRNATTDAKCNQSSLSFGRRFVYYRVGVSYVTKVARIDINIMNNLHREKENALSLKLNELKPNYMWP